MALGAGQHLLATQSLFRGSNWTFTTIHYPTLCDLLFRELPLKLFRSTTWICASTSRVVCFTRPPMGETLRQQTATHPHTARGIDLVQNFNRVVQGGALRFRFDILPHQWNVHEAHCRTIVEFHWIYKSTTKKCKYNHFSLHRVL